MSRSRDDHTIAAIETTLDALGLHYVSQLAGSTDPAVRLKLSAPKFGMK